MSILLAVIVPVAALWLGGGLRPADRPVRARPGQEVDQHLFRTRLMGAHVATSRKTPYQPSGRLLVVNAWVTNTSRETQWTHGPDDVFFSHGLFPRWGAGPAPRLLTAQSLAGDTLFYSLQPREPTYVAVQYDLPAGARVPDRLTVGLAGYAYTSAGILDPRGYWSYDASGYRTVRERDPVTHRVGLATETVPRMVAEVTLPVRRS